MKKAMVLALCLILAGLLAVNSTFAFELPSLDKIFTTFTNWLTPPQEDETLFNVELVYPDGESVPMLSPGGTISRKIAVENLSVSETDNPNNAYFRVAFALQKEAMPYVTLGFSKSDDFTWQGWKEITIGSKPYCLMVATYQHSLAANTTSPTVLETVALDQTMTSELLQKLDPQFLKVQVLAIDADDFQQDQNGVSLSAKEALDLAMPISGTFNPFQ